ncbi:hypothetical protein APV28_4097 [Comamonas testosteroni]|nr:hypothetical protein APV28_4097 [Comamonas testosteroni]
MTYATPCAPGGRHPRLGAPAVRRLLLDASGFGRVSFKR